MKKINLTTIKKLDPCQDRLDNFANNYNNKEFTIKQFLRLSNITHEDKLWVVFRLMSKKNLRFVAGEIAQSVLHVFEKELPNDDRPRKAIEIALKKGKVDKKVANEATNAARAAYGYAAAHTAYTTAYAAVANAANAASYAANAADAAYDAAAYATNAARAARAARAAVAANAADRKKQEKLQLKIIRKYWK